MEINNHLCTFCLWFISATLVLKKIRYLLIWNVDTMLFLFMMFYYNSRPKTYNKDYLCLTILCLAKCCLDLNVLLHKVHGKESPSICISACNLTCPLVFVVFPHVRHCQRSPFFVTISSTALNASILEESWPINERDLLSIFVLWLCFLSSSLALALTLGLA